MWESVKDTCVVLLLKSFNNMGTRIPQMHEILSGYLGPSSGPPTFTVPNQPLNARLPVSPGDGIPGGIRPIPTSSQSSKKTNAQIPYVRLVYSARGTAGLRASPKEGDIVFVEQTTLYRKDPGARLGHGTNSYAYTKTIESINSGLETPRDKAYTYETFPYRLDGVVNNVDSEDPQDEFLDYTIANVAVYGPCRLDHSDATRCDFKKTHPGSILYVGLEAIEKGGKFKHELVRFSSAQLSRGVHVLKGESRTLVCAWTLGMLMDSNQSKNMVTVMVNVSPIRAIDPKNLDHVDPHQIHYTGEGEKRKMSGAYYAHKSDDTLTSKQLEIKPLSAADQLNGKWDIPKPRPRGDWH